ADLVTAIESGYFADQQSVRVIMSLLWHGEVAQATSILAILREDAHRQVTERTTPCLDQLCLWLPVTYPGMALGVGCGHVFPTSIGASAWAPEHRAVAALGTVLRGAGDEAAVGAAELVLQEARDGVASPASSTAALAALIYSDRLHRASMWSDSLVACV